MNAELRAKTAENIERFGRIIIYVADKDETPFAYTIGNKLVAKPELILAGPIGPDIAQVLLNETSAKLESGKDPPHEVSFGGPYPVRLRKTLELAKDEFAIQAGEYLQQPYDLYQIVLCDESGRWPGDEKIDPRYARQPILYPNTN